MVRPSNHGRISLRHAQVERKGTQFAFYYPCKTQWKEDEGMRRTGRWLMPGVIATLVLVTGCATPLTPRESGTLTGAGVGAAAGAVLGGIAGSPGKGAAIGAGVGALTGLLTGNAIQNEQAAG